MPTTTYSDKTRAADLKDIVRPVQLNNGWVELLAAGQVAQVDNEGADIVNPDTEVDAGNDIVINIAGRGTLAALMLGYDDALTVSADPVLQLFGRLRDEGGRWMRLKNIADDIDIDLPTAASDAADGTLKYTTVDLQETVADLMGCDELVARVKTALAGTGSTANAIVLAKFL